ncbi:MAG: hypothetical protein HYZ14_18095 [Bacteroidetes bacterium]|nr:hypothetical protein [Bacteroidota bacterium]
MKGLLVAGVLIAVFSLSLTSRQPENSLPANPAVDTTLLVKQHNFYRQRVNAPDIHWSDELAVYAQAWANKLAKTCQLQHSGGKYGENIYWTSDEANEQAVVDYWAEEEKYFNHKNPTYIRGKSSKSGHYSQVIWAKSTLVGAGVANCKGGGQIWVCVYDPPGNMIGEKAY